LLRPDWLAWYGERGVLPLSALAAASTETGINVFQFLPAGDAAVQAFFWILFAASVSLMAGFCTRTSSALVFLGLVSLHHRDPLPLDGGDTALRVLGFGLMFSHAGRAFSVDRWLRIRRGLEADGPPAAESPWAQRLIQLQLCLIYLSSFLWKAHGSAWTDGSALYYVFQLDEYRRFSMPYWMSRVPVFFRLGSWTVLFLEFSLATLVWIRDLRYTLLAAGLLLHLGIEFSMNIPIFEWVMISAYVLFLRPEDLRRWLTRRDVKVNAGVAGAAEDDVFL